jgi:DNA-binding transcriptional LysR family regulator
MIGTVELREIRVLLTLEERHFGRTARRLTLTPSRVSQTLRTLETRVGGRLFDRTSRHVSLTPLGEQLVRELRPAYQQLEQALDAARQQATGIAGTLRLGMYTPVNGGPHIVEIIKTFEARHPACTVVVTDTGLARNQLDWLRDGDVDLLAMRLPISERDLTVGPVLSREERIVAVATDHPLAGNEEISYEELADYPVSDAHSLPREMIDAFIPPRTPSGRVLQRIESGSLLTHHRHPRITTVPIRDLPPSETALVWARANRSLKIEVFVETAAEVLRSHGTTSTPAQGSPKIVRDDHHREGPLHPEIVPAAPDYAA